MFEQFNTLPSDIFHRLIQKFGKGDIKGMIKKSTALGLNGDMKLEGDSGASGEGNGDNI